MRSLQRCIIIAFVLVLLAFGASTVYNRIVIDHTPPVITCASDVVTVSVNDPQEALLAGVTATDDRDGDLTSQVMVQSVSTLITNSTAKVTYIVFDHSNNMATVSRTVQYSDYTRPTFSLSSPLVFGVGKTVTLKDRLRATDSVDGNITSRIRIASQNVSTQTPGTYTMTVQVTNSLGDTASVPLNVIITDGRTQQQIELSDFIVYLHTGDTFDPFSYVTRLRSAYGAEGDQSRLTADGTVDTATPGIYNVLFTYSNAAEGLSDYCAYMTVIVE